MSTLDLSSNGDQNVGAGDTILVTEGNDEPILSLAEKYLKLLNNTQHDVDSSDDDDQALILAEPDLLTKLMQSDEAQRRRRSTRSTDLMPELTKLSHQSMDLFTRAMQRLHVGQNGNTNTGDDDIEIFEKLSEEQKQKKIDEMEQLYHDKMRTHPQLIQKNLESQYQQLLSIIEKSISCISAKFNDDKSSDRMSNTYADSDLARLNQVVEHIASLRDNFISVQSEVKDLLDKLELVERCRMKGK